MSRWRIECVLAAVFAALGVTTFLVPDWIEVLFKVDPDAGNGGLEWALVGLFGGLTLAAVLMGTRDYRAATQPRRPHDWSSR